jgi:hypothetical protein
MYSSRFAFLIVACAAMLFTGCANMFHSKPDLEIVGPPDIQVESVHGGPLNAYRDEGGLVVHSNSALTDSLRITYENYSTSVALAKNPDALEFLNLLSYGIGFVVDDLSHSWFDYAPVYVMIDSGSHGVTGISASSLNWLGEAPGDRKVHALLLMGFGLSFQQTESGVSFLPGETGYPLGSIQGGLGVDYNKQFELFYLVRSEAGYALDNNADESAVINASDICLRYFFQKNLFVQGSFGRAYASDYSYNEVDFYDPVLQEHIPTPSNPAFNEVGAAIGWAGDLSYISLQYFGGLTSFSTPDYTNIRYHTVYLNFGLNFRI